MKNLLYHDSYNIRPICVPFGLLTWGQHIAMVKSKDEDEAICYMRKSIEGKWGRETLKKKLIKGSIKSYGLSRTKLR